MSYDYFTDLVHSIAASRILLQKAHRDGALIEGLCLYVSTIDALLRLGIIYIRTQRAPDHTYSVAKGLIRQDDGERTYSEREVYIMALQDGVIDQALHNRLQNMYNFRNKVVHRFNISGIIYQEIAETCIAFEGVYQEVMKIIDILENGPHGPRPQSDNERRESLTRLAAKLGGTEPDASSR